MQRDQHHQDIQDQEIASQDRDPLDSDRYLDIIGKSRIPMLGLLRESIREDKRLLLPRAIRISLHTALRIPHSLSYLDQNRRERYIFDTLSAWGRKISHLFQMRLRVEGTENLDPSQTYLFIANHQSPADIVALYAAMPIHAGFVSTSIMGEIPVFSYWMRQSGAVFVVQGDPRGELRAFRTMVKRLKRGRSLILFPEGFMYQGPGLGVFNRGGIQSAYLAKVPVVPIFVGGTNEVMRSGSLHIEPRRDVLIQFGKPYYIEGKGHRAVDQARDELRDQIFSMKMARAEALSKRRFGSPSASRQA